MGLYNLSEDCFLHKHNHNELWNIPLVLQWVLAFDQKAISRFIFPSGLCAYTPSQRDFEFFGDRDGVQPFLYYLVSYILKHLSHDIEKVDRASLPQGGPVGMNPCQ